MERDREMGTVVLLMYTVSSYTADYTDRCAGVPLAGPLSHLPGQQPGPDPLSH